jgi:hypothetical protein
MVAVFHVTSAPVLASKKRLMGTLLYFMQTVELLLGPGEIGPILYPLFAFVSLANPTGGNEDNSDFCFQASYLVTGYISLLRPLVLFILLALQFLVVYSVKMVCTGKGRRKRAKKIAIRLSIKYSRTASHLFVGAFFKTLREWRTVGTCLT